MVSGTEAVTPPDFTPSSRQREAIEAPLGPVLVLAGPGAGKTFCLIERTRFLIEQKGFDPSRICAVTFTNRAAQEIAERLQKALGSRGEGVKGGTLHALCAEILREHGQAIGVQRGFGIADEEYQKDVLRRLGVWGGRQTGLLSRFGLYRTKGTELGSDDRAIFLRYTKHLELRNLLDFDDLVVQTAELFRALPETAEEVAGRWDYVLVDEFQDLNPRQYEVVRRLGWRHRNLFVVGDDEQSVFSWTGADPQILKVFQRDFGVTEVLLDENRRTARRIFDTARRLLDSNPRLFEAKVLVALHETDFPVTALSFDTERAEARWLIADLLRDRASEDRPWGDFAVLYRKHEVGSNLEAEFIRAGVPCRLASGRALRDNPVVKYLIAALKVIAEPGDPVHHEAFARAVLPRGMWYNILAEAEQKQETPTQVMRRQMKGPPGDEGVKKIRRAHYALQNLPAQARKHTTLLSLVEDLLSQRVGEYRTVLESAHEELTDPAADPGIVELAGRLTHAMHGRRRVWLSRMGGLEFALSGLLLRGGVTSVAYGEPPGEPNDAIEMVIASTWGTGSGLVLALFKALQIAHTGALKDAFRDFVAIDIETTDRNPSTCETIELAAIRVRDGVIADRYQQLVRPRGTVHEAARAKHGISDEMLLDQPFFEAAWPAFRAFCGDDVVVAHNGNGFDFPILRRQAKGLPDWADFVSFDSLPLARDLHRTSAKLGDLAHLFGIDLTRAHRAEADALALAGVFPLLQAEKLTRARKTALVHLLDYLGLALAVADPSALSPEGEVFWKVSRAFTLGRFSDCLEYYRLARSSTEALDAPSLDDVINRLGGRRKMEYYRQIKSADDRYPAAMARLRLLLDGSEETTLEGQLREFLDRVALSYSGTDSKDPDLANGVNLLTMHSTKGLEFSRVYIVGAEDGQMLLKPREGGDPPVLEVQESRRLLYVGMTRAKDRLVMTRAERRKDLPTGGFRFLEEMGLRPVPPE